MTQDLRGEAARCAEVLQQWYRADRYADFTGLYRYNDPGIAGRRRTALRAAGQLHGMQDTGRWWNSANAVTALIGYAAAATSEDQHASIAYTFGKAPRAYVLTPKTIGVTAVAGAVVGAGVGAGIGSTAGAGWIAGGGVLGLVAGILAAAAGSLATNARVRYRDFIGEYYDDMGWWALAWIAAYDLTRDDGYLKSAQVIFEAMTKGWDDVWGGGIYWQRNGKGPSYWRSSIYKNAIANELFIAIAAALALRAGDDTDKASYWTDWAVRDWTWFSAAPPHGVAMINDQDLVNDAPNPDGVNDNTQPIWSYNQGVILGALCDLAERTGDEAYLKRAESIADAFIVTPVYRAAHRPPPPSSGVIDGILHEEGDCDASGNGAPASPLSIDCAQFKGIFVRNLARLYLRSRKDSYRQFILHNAETAMSFARDGAYGGNWAAPPDVTDFVRQTSALDLLTAAMIVTDAAG